MKDDEERAVLEVPVEPGLARAFEAAAAEAGYTPAAAIRQLMRWYLQNNSRAVRLLRLLKRRSPAD